MNKLHVRTGDTVQVLSGKDIDKKGKILASDPSTGMVLVEGINMVSRHKKPRKQGESGGIVKSEGYIRASKVIRVCPKCNKTTRLAHKVEAGGIKTRVCKKCGAEI